MTANLVLGPDLQAFIEAGPAIRVGTCDNQMVPVGIMGWAARVSGEGRAVEVFIDQPASQPTLDNLRANGQIAVVFTDCKTDRSIQLKGRCVEIGDPDLEDWSWIDDQRERLLLDLTSVGYSQHMVRSFWSSQVIRLRFVVSHVYDQTPGAGAGRPL